ncbi:MAG: hypothetical protein AAF802_14770 [Planctomycetota bacterium]
MEHLTCPSCGRLFYSNVRKQFECCNHIILVDVPPKVSLRAQPLPVLSGDDNYLLLMHPFRYITQLWDHQGRLRDWVLSREHLPQVESLEPGTDVVRWEWLAEDAHKLGREVVEHAEPPRKANLCPRSAIAIRRAYQADFEAGGYDPF